MKPTTLSRIKILRKTIILIIWLVFVAACNKESAPKIGASANDTFRFSKNEVTIGTFNLEWFGDGNNDRKDRTNDDLKNYAKIIKELDVDILAVQEIENDVALNHLVGNYLPNYTYYLGREGGAQKIGFIFKKGLNITYIGEYYPLMIQEGRTKPGLLVKCSIKNFDFLLLAVHLKSSSHWDNTPEKIENSFGVRTKQAEAIAHWEDSVLAKKTEQDLIVLGDFNDTPRRKKDNTLYSLSNFKFLTGDMKSCRLKNAYTIDQIITSPSATDRVIPNSEFMYNISSSFSPEEAEGLSDHCPVIVKFDVTKPDADPSKRIAKK